MNNNQFFTAKFFERLSVFLTIDSNCLHPYKMTDLNFLRQNAIDLKNFIISVHLTKNYINSFKKHLLNIYVGFVHIYIKLATGPPPAAYARPFGMKRHSRRENFQIFF